MKKIFIIFFSLTFFITFSQKKTCDKPEINPIVDLNTITKCNVNKSKQKGKNSRVISVNVSAPRKRFFKKRIKAKNSVNSVGKELNTSGLAKTKVDKSINTILNLSNTLSAEEIKNADKFSTVERIPNFKECENSKNKEQLECFNIEMIKHIEKNFRYPNEAIINKNEGEVWVRFIIDKNGKVTNVKTVGPQNGEILEHEALRVVSKLPNFIPGKKNGKNTSVKYGFPINFSLAE